VDKYPYQGWSLLLWQHQYAGYAVHLPGAFSQVRDILIKYGADPEAKDNSGKIPEELFTEVGSQCL